MAHPQITTVVDCDALPWVSPHASVVHTPWGDVHLARALLSDGASSVPDLEYTGWMSHDRLCLCPYVWRSNRRVRLSKCQCDRLYGWILRQRASDESSVLQRCYQYGAGIWRPLALMAGIPAWVTWRRYRKREAVDPDWWAQPYPDGRMVPDSRHWRFPTQRTRDAVWVA